jgi:hypothetical protein
MNSMALQGIEKLPDIPNAQLAIESGENLAPLPNIVEYPSVLKQPTYPDISNISYERASIDGYANPVQETDFPKSYYMGSPIGGA